MAWPIDTSCNSAVACSADQLEYTPSQRCCVHTTHGTAAQRRAAGRWGACMFVYFAHRHSRHASPFPLHLLFQSIPAMLPVILCCHACRWLEPGAARSLSQYQLPFGTGQRTCLGMNLANAEMIAVLAELSRSYTLAADWQTDWKDFPIKRPDNGLPLRLAHRAGAAADAAASALPSSAPAAAATV
jgi:hypothetical protein